MLKKDKIILEKYNGIHPTCECGCGEQTRYEAKLKDYCRFISGHQSRLKGHWGDLKSEKRVNAIKKTRKEKFASGEYDHILKQVSKPRSEETIDKIKNTKKNNPYTHKESSKTAISEFRKQFKFSEESKEKMSQSAINNIIKTDRNHTSKLEVKFGMFLELLDIKFEKFLYAKEIKAFYDFYIPGYNILIEVDGDFWHCNPKKFPTPDYESQKRNLERDKVKNQWAVDNGYKILRFWENDINNNIQEIKHILLEALS